MKKKAKRVQRPRPRHQQKLSPVQQSLIMKIFFALLVAALLWVLFAPGSGIMSLIGKRAELKKLQQDTGQLEQDNRLLQEEIDRLQNDSAYLEEVARKEYGLLKKNEKVYDFSPPKPVEKK